MAKSNIDIVNEKLFKKSVDSLQYYFTNIERHTLSQLHQKKISKEIFIDRAVKYLTDSQKIDDEIAKKELNLKFKYLKKW